MTTFRLAFGLASFTLVIAAFGCGKSEPTSGPINLPEGMGSKGGPPAGIGGPPGGAAASSGNAVFDKNCSGCHSVVAGPADPKAKGPNLSKVGAEHKAEWIADFVKNPGKVKANSKMPEFAGKLSAEDLKSVSEFLAGKK
jgi:cytochrome c2